ncbi:MAG TPA: hypothetical protein VFS69_03345 [Sphingomicrobium sp.]|nr:hypothetical protein [Sphingomicrobium sp.]
MSATMTNVDRDQQQARLEEAFERIEETILPCIAMMLETLLDASATAAETDPKALAAELQILAAELEELTQAVERSSPVHVEPGEYKTSTAA